MGKSVTVNFPTKIAHFLEVGQEILKLSGGTGAFDKCPNRFEFLGVRRNLKNGAWAGYMFQFHESPSLYKLISATFIIFVLRRIMLSDAAGK